MLSWVIYLKTKLIFVKKIVIYEIFIQTIIHNRLKHFGKKWKNRNWSVVLNIFFIPLLKLYNNFLEFLKRCLKIFEENELYKIVDTYNDITVKTITTNGFVSFEYAKWFLEFLKRTFFLHHRVISLRQIFNSVGTALASKILIV